MWVVLRVESKVELLVDLMVVWMVSLWVVR